MNVINCIECGNLCIANSAKLCPSCMESFFEDEIKIADYLRNHEHSTVDEVHQATGVKKHIIMRMIAEGRIIEGHLAYPCEKCGAAISSGIFCKNCSEDVLTTLKPKERKLAEPETPNKGMFVTKALD